MLESREGKGESLLEKRRVKEERRKRKTEEKKERRKERKERRKEEKYLSFNPTHCSIGFCKGKSFSKEGLWSFDHQEILVLVAPLPLD